MSANPYAPPTAAVDDVRPEESAAQPPFFAVSLTKLLIMSVCTLSLYELYWFYRNWKCIKARERTNISPAPRAIFAYFYCYQCFSRIRDYDVEKTNRSNLAAGALAAGWIVTTLLWKLPDPYWWFSELAVFFLLPVQARVNQLNAEANPAHDRNARLRGWNWLAVVLGGALVLLAMVGTLMPEGQ